MKKLRKMFYKVQRYFWTLRVKADDYLRQRKATRQETKAAKLGIEYKQPITLDIHKSSHV